MTELHIDFETRSAFELRKGGVYPYAEHPTTDVTVICYAFDDDPVQTWWPVDLLCPPEIEDHVRAGGDVYAHNAQFERCIWWTVLARRYGWPRPAREQFFCTAAMAAALALPRDLEGAGRAMNLVHQKDKDGWRLMLKMAKPYKIVNGQPVWWEKPEDFERLAAYCRQDVETERAFHKAVFPLIPSERAVYLMDARINDRGVRVDLPLVHAARKIVSAQTDKLQQAIRGATGWRVQKPTQRSAIVEWCKDQGVEITSLAKKPLKDLLESDDLPPDVRAVLEIRQEAAKASNAKLNAMVNSVCGDQRIRGLLLYHGASTGRWSGKLVQPQNFPRGTGTVEEPEEAIPYLMGGDVGLIDMMFGPPLNVVSDTLRSMLTAAPGKELIAADLANIEGRENAWLAGEAWKLRAFSDFDTGTGPDLYKVTAAGIFGKAIEDVTKSERQVGKVAELALGYQGGVNAFLSMSHNYPGTDKDVLRAFSALWESASTETRERVMKSRKLAVGAAATMPWEWWAAAEITKRNWRSRHPAIVNLWEQLDAAAIMAVRNPDSKVQCGKLIFMRRFGFLWMRLPSGRSLAYAAPEIRMKKAPWLDRGGNPVYLPYVSFLGTLPGGRGWGRQDLYGGQLCENAVQAIARDLLAENMLLLEDMRYPMVLSVHDEAVSEVDEGWGDLAVFEQTLARVPAWNAGCPVTAKGWRGLRYRKD